MRDDGLFPVPTPLALINLTSNITVIPYLSVFDIFNCLTALKRFQNLTFCGVNKMKGYTMAKHGYVLEILFHE